MAEIVFSSPEPDTSGEKYRTYAVDEGGANLSSATFIYTESAFGEGFVKTLVIGGVNTPVHNRRGGNVRRIFEEIHKKAIEDNVAVALLHPFSFSYYRKFGYEKVSDHVIVTTPLEKLDFVERKCELIRYTDKSQAKDLCEIYNEFAKGRNLLIKRYNEGYFQLDIPNRYIEIYYDEGKPAGYITYWLHEAFVVNRMTNGVIEVDEIAYTSPKALRAILSFLRLYEGEMDTLTFKNIAPCPELEMMLRHYNHTTYSVVADVEARILNSELVFKSASYPKSQGSFSVKIDDVYDSVKGSFLVEWSESSVSVSRLDEGQVCELELSVGALTRLIYGYDGADAATAAYMEGVKINNPDTEFFRVFRKRAGGNFEHF